MVTSWQWYRQPQGDLGAVHRQLNRELGLATDRELVELFKDCEPGALPPLGLAYGIDTILDESLVDVPESISRRAITSHWFTWSGSGFPQVDGQRAARPDQLSRVVIEKSGCLRLAPIVACSRAQGGASTLGRPGPIACRGDRNENDARLSALRERLSHLTHDAWNSIVTDDGSREDYGSQYPPPHKWRAEFYLAGQAQPPALAGATRAGSDLRILEFLRSEVHAAERVA